MTKVAVLTLTRDRLPYTEHCFEKLHELAGCDYDHYVFDQGSIDGTVRWLEDNRERFAFVDYSAANVGISNALNRLLAAAGHDYDVYVKFDNDCELTVPDTLKTATELVHEHDGWILSPKIEGLNSPPGVSDIVEVGGHQVGCLSMIGGIFMAVSGRVFKNGWRYDAKNPTWGMDDATLGSWFRGQGGQLGYLLDIPANHYETTEGQKERFPQYWERKKLEMGIK